MLNELQTQELQELEELHISDITEDGVSEAKERFKVTDVNSANWCFKKIKALKCKCIEYETLVENEKKKLELWLEKETKQLKNNIEFFNMLLTEYAESERLKDKKFKLKTPNGSISFRKQQPEIKYDDVEQLVKWLEENQKDKPEIIKVKKDISKSEFKKAFKLIGDKVITDDGEIIPNVKVVEREESIHIKTNED